jgi:hypothetical protein
LSHYIWEMVSAICVNSVWFLKPVTLLHRTKEFQRISYPWLIFILAVINRGLLFCTSGCTHYFGTHGFLTPFDMHKYKFFLCFFSTPVYCLHFLWPPYLIFHFYLGLSLHFNFPLPFSWFLRKTSGYVDVLMSFSRSVLPVFILESQFV